MAINISVVIRRFWLMRANFENHLLVTRARARVGRSGVHQYGQGVKSKCGRNNLANEDIGSTVGLE